jgi:opacity protein-like surface antigen
MVEVGEVGGGCSADVPTSPGLHRPPPTSTNFFEGASMKNVMLTVGLLIGLATPLAAQWLGEPVWNSPKGGTGVTISGDYAKPNTDYGKGNTWGGRASLGLSTITLTAGVASWKPEGFTQSLTSVGGNVAFRLIGGSLLPVAINMQVGGASTSESGVSAKETTLIGAAGISVPLPTPGISIEPYFSPGIRYHNPSPSALGNSTEFGYAVGANLSFGLLGAHLAYDNEKLKGGGSRGVFGVGLHVGIHLPLGM